MLSDHEREALHEIQAGLLVEDPGFAQSFDSAVRDRHAITQTGGAQFFTNEQTIKHLTSSNMQIILEEQSSLFKYGFLAVGVQFHHDI